MMHHALNKAVPDNPVYLRRVDGHAGFANARAVKLMGITKDTQPPEGVKIINGTDAPVEDVDPIKNFYASVTRQKEDGTPHGGYYPDQRMSRYEALRSYTLDAAYGAFTEKTKGSIEVGKLADFTVLSKDIMTVPEMDILKAEVTYTIVDGKVVYEKGKPTRPAMP